MHQSGDLEHLEKYSVKLKWSPITPLGHSSTFESENIKKEKVGKKSDHQDMDSEEHSVTELLHKLAPLIEGHASGNHL